MKCLIPALFFMLPSLQQPGKFVKVPLDRLPATKKEIIGSAHPDLVKFRYKWKVQAHRVCQKQGYHCAKELIIHPDGARIFCVTYELK